MPGRAGQGVRRQSRRWVAERRLRNRSARISGETFLRHILGQGATLRAAPLGCPRAERAFFQRLEHLFRAFSLHRLAVRRLRVGSWSFMADSTVSAVQGGPVLRMSSTRHNENAEPDAKVPHA